MIVTCLLCIALWHLVPASLLTRTFRLILSATRARKKSCLPTHKRASSSRASAWSTLTPCPSLPVAKWARTLLRILSRLSSWPFKISSSLTITLSLHSASPTSALSTRALSATLPTTWPSKLRTRSSKLPCVAVTAPFLPHGGPTPNRNSSRVLWAPWSASLMLRLTTL